MEATAVLMDTDSDEDGSGSESESQSSGSISLEHEDQSIVVEPAMTSPFDVGSVEASRRESKRLRSNPDELDRELEKYIGFLVTHAPDEKTLLAGLSELVCEGDPRPYFRAREEASSVCAYVFKANEPAYCCYTCGQDQTCIQCMECFQNSNHEGHDVVMTRTGSNGQCDCGDASSWAVEGFCCRHRGFTNRTKDEMLAKWSKADRLRLERVAVAILDVLLRCLMAMNNYDWLPDESWLASRSNIMRNQGDSHICYLHNDELHSVQLVVEMLHHVAGLSLRDANVVTNRIDDLDFAALGVYSLERATSFAHQFRAEGFECHVESVQPDMVLISTSRASCILEWLSDLCSYSDGFRLLLCNHMLSDPPGRTFFIKSSDSEPIYLLALMRCTFSLPKKLSRSFTIFTFQLFIHVPFKEKFAIVFTDNYEMLLSRSVHKGSYRDSVMDYSVQLYTIPNMIMRIARTNDSIAKLLSSVSSLVESCCDENGRIIFSEANSSLFKFGLQASFRDLQYIFGNKELPAVFIGIPVSETDSLEAAAVERNDRLLNGWMRLLLRFEGMDGQQRHAIEHIEYERDWVDCWNLSISIGQLNGTLIRALENSLMKGRDRSWLRCFVDLQLLPLIRRFLSELSSSGNATCLVLFYRTHYSRSAVVDYRVDLQPVSFHLHLSRFLILSMVAIVRHGKVSSMAELFGVLNPSSTANDDVVCMALLDHPLYGLVDGSMRLIAATCHIHAKLWVRNGDAAFMQAFNYSASSLRSEMADPDFVALQMGISVFGHDWFLSALLHRFLLYGFFDEMVIDSSSTSISGPYPWSSWDQDKLVLVIEQFLTLLVWIVSDRRFTGEFSDEDEMLRVEVIQWLMLESMAFSKLIKKVGISAADRSDVERLESCLGSVSTYVQPNATKTGQFKLKASMICRFDPFFPKFTTAERQIAEGNYLMLAASSRRESNASTEGICPPAPLLPPIREVFRPLWDIFTSELLFHILRKIFLLGESARSTHMVQCALRLLRIATEDIKKGYATTEKQDAFVRAIISENGGQKSFLFVLLESLESASPMMKAARSSIIDAVNGLGGLSMQCSEIIGGRVEDSLRAEEAQKAREDRNRRRQHARERAMAEMQQRRRQFEDGNANEFVNIDAQCATTLGHRNLATKIESLHCTICRSNENSTELSALAFICRSRSFELQWPEASRCRSENDRSSTDSQLTARLCGHTMHYSCFSSYIESSMNAHMTGQPYEGLGAIDIEAGQFVCPLCKCVANCLIPLSRSAEPASGEHLVESAPSVPVSVNNYSPVQSAKSLAEWCLVSRSFSLASGLQSISLGGSQRRAFVMLSHRLRVTNDPSMIFVRAPSEEYTADEVNCSWILCHVVSDCIQQLESACRLQMQDGDQSHSVLSAVNSREVQLVSTLYYSLCGLVLDDACRIAAGTKSTLQILQEETWASICSIDTLERMMYAKSPFARLVDFFVVATCDCSAPVGGVVMMLPPKYHGMLTHATKVCFVAQVANARMIMEREPADPQVMYAIETFGYETGGDIMLELLCLPFVRQALLLMHFAGCCPVSLNDCHYKSPIEEYSDFLEAFGFHRRFGHAEDLMAEVDKTRPLPFEVELLHRFMTNMRKEQDHWKTVSKNSRAYVVPRLAHLPSNYGVLFQRSAGWQCNSCMRVPRTPAVCLLCGAMLCATDPCCRSADDIGELTVHAREHNEGQGIFLLLSFCKVLLICDGFAAPFNSPYLDEHGEEDEGLRRGMPLYLDLTRWRELHILAQGEISAVVTRARVYDRIRTHRNTW